MLASLIGTIVAFIASVVVAVPVPAGDVLTIPDPDVAAGAPWIDPDDVDRIRDTYGDAGVRVLCTGDYTGAPDETAALGDEDSAAVDDIFDTRDYYGIAYGETAC